VWRVGDARHAAPDPEKKRDIGRRPGQPWRVAGGGPAAEKTRSSPSASACAFTCLAVFGEYFSADRVLARSLSDDSPSGYRAELADAAPLGLHADHAPVRQAGAHHPGQPMELRLGVDTALATQYASPTSLSAVFDLTLVAPGSYTLYAATPGGGSSNALAFQVTATLENIPTLPCLGETHFLPEPTLDLGHLSVGRQAILNILETSLHPLTPIEISHTTGQSNAAVRLLLKRMADSGEIGRPARGLYIAHQIVLAHGGTIDARSSEGTTTFVVRLPRSPPSRPERRTSLDG